MRKTKSNFNMQLSILYCVLYLCLYIANRMSSLTLQWYVFNFVTIRNDWALLKYKLRVKIAFCKGWDLNIDYWRLFLEKQFFFFLKCQWSSGIARILRVCVWGGDTSWKPILQGRGNIKILPTSVESEIVLNLPQLCELFETSNTT